MADLRTSPGAAVLMIGDRTVVHGGDRRRALDLPPAQLPTFVAALAALRDWQSPADAAAALAAVTGASSERAVAQLGALLDAGLLEASDTDPAFARDDDWDRHGWADAHRYHRHLRRLPIVDWSLDESVRVDVDLMRDYLSQEEPPDPYLVLPTVDRHPAPMPPGDRVGPFVDTRTEPAESALSWDELATVLAFTFGQTGTRRLPVTGAHLTKTSPSGGSRHPTEAFVLLLRDVEGRPPGRYHWNVRDHSLDLIAAGDHRDAVRTHVIRLPGRPAFPPVAVVVLVAVCERSMFRYRESRSYRVLLHDAGHLLQTFASVGSALGRPTYRGYTVHEPAVTSLLDLEPLRHLPLAFGALG